MLIITPKLAILGEEKCALLLQALLAFCRFGILRLLRDHHTAANHIVLGKPIGKFGFCFSRNSQSPRAVQAHAEWRCFTSNYALRREISISQTKTDRS